MLATDVFDHICYVAPHNPSFAVLNLDAHKRLDQATTSLFLSAFVISVAIGLTVVRNLRRKKESSGRASS
jgi:hypothetical protein